MSSPEVILSSGYRVAFTTPGSDAGAKFGTTANLRLAERFLAARPDAIPYAVDADGNPAEAYPLPSPAPPSLAKGPEPILEPAAPTEASKPDPNGNSVTLGTPSTVADDV